MREPFGMPGVGGSLGKCALCGKPFIAEILLDKPVKTFHVKGCEQTLFAHDDCLANAPKEYKDLPDESPLKQAWQELA